MSPEPLPPDAFDFEAVFDVDDYLYFYREMLTDERTDAEVAAIVNLLDLRSPLKILDLACGFGRHANRLAALGHQVSGVDLFPGFLEIARQDAERKGVTVAYQQKDMRQISDEDTYDLVLLLFTAFGYFDEEDNLLVLRKICKALKPGGRFLMDAPNRDAAIKGNQPYFVTEKEGNLMIDRVTFDTLSGRTQNRRIVIRDGVRRDKPFSIRLYNPNEMTALLRQAGLQLEQFYGDWDGQPLQGEGRRMIILARKA